VLGLLATAGFVGCAAGPDPAGTPVPPVSSSNLVVGASDSVSSIPGSPNAPYIYRFRQIEPGSERFTYQDRELSFYFKPTPDALHFQVENRQNRPVWIDWERSVFYDAQGQSGKVAHATTQWENRFKSQPSTQVAGLQRYSDYLLPLNYLYDPAGSPEQPHRPLLPEDATSPQYTDRVFGVDLAMTVEDRPRTYTFRFRVASVIPR
jgi:hypothetical protein